MARKLRNLFSGRRPRGKSETGGGEVDRLRRHVDELSMLNTLALEMTTSVEPEEIVETLIGRVMRWIGAEQAVVTLVDDDSADAQQTRVRLMRTSAEGPSFRLSSNLLGWMYIHKDTLVVNSPKNDKRFQGVSWEDGIRDLMCVPLMAKSQLIGVITLCNKKGTRGFTDDDARLLPIIAAQSAQIIENARLAKERAAMQHQVKLAYDIQRNLLPDAPPEIEGYDIAGTSVPAQTVGGDYFDYIPTGGGRWAICLGDVSGKGLPASLLMANVQSALRVLSVVEKDADRCVDWCNKLLCQSTGDETFVTLFYSVLDPARHTVSYCNAGQECAILRAGDGALKPIEPNGMIVGAIDEASYEKQAIPMDPGDVLVIYSDGVPDMTNARDEAFGQERLAALLRDSAKLPAAVVVEKTIQAARAHAGPAPQFDDLTVVVVKRTS